MLYYVTKFLGWFGFRVFFRKIYYTGRNKIPKGKPIIFAVNHPTAFIDPVISGTYINPTVHFIVRGDIFNSKIVRAILSSLKMYPIFRFRDGFSSLKNNHATMDFCYKLLKDGKNILILAEGQTKHEKRLRPIQKGTARMAFGAIEKYGELDIVVVPIGVNYTDSNQFRSEVMMKVGESLYLKDLMPVYHENPRKAVKQLTDSISDELKKLVIHVDKKSNDDLVNRFLDIQRNSIEKTLLPNLSTSDELFNKEFAAVNAINNLSDEENGAFKNAVDDYDNALKVNDCKDLGVAQPQSNNFSTTFFILFGFLPYLIGLLLNSLPLILAKRLADNKVKKIEFRSSVLYGAGLVFYTLYWLFFLIIALITGNNIFIGIVLCAPLLGYFSLLYQEVLDRWKAARRFNRLSNEAKEKLITMRSSLFEIVKTL